jgi:hypothetical protein
MRSRSTASVLALGLAFALYRVPRLAAAETSDGPGPRRASLPAEAEPKVQPPTTNARTGEVALLDVGAGFFAVTYGATALAGTLLWGLHSKTGSGSTSVSDSNRWSPLLVPVVGPLISIGTVPQLRTSDGIELMLLLAACQGGGLALAIAGGIEAHGRRSRAVPSVAVGPGGGSLRWTF